MASLTPHSRCLDCGCIFAPRTDDRPQCPDCRARQYQICRFGLPNWDREVEAIAAQLAPPDCESSHLEDLASDWEHANTCAADGH